MWGAAVLAFTLLGSAAHGYEFPTHGAVGTLDQSCLADMNAIFNNNYLLTSTAESQDNRCAVSVPPDTCILAPLTRVLKLFYGRLKLLNRIKALRKCSRRLKLSLKTVAYCRTQAWFLNPQRRLGCRLAILEALESPTTDNCPPEDQLLKCFWVQSSTYYLSSLQV